MKMQSRQLLSASLLVLLAACGGSETQVVEQPLPPPVDEKPITYSGPAAATEDVQNFKIEVWDNIATQERCAACHVQADQAPTFARNDDINLAYRDAAGLIDIANPQDSRLVTKVAEGHNCWLASDSACADIMITWISKYANSQGEAVANQIQLKAPQSRTSGANKNFPLNSTLFESHVYPLLQSYCADCHTSTATIPIAPYFSSSDVDEAYLASKARINLDDPASSRIVSRVRDEFHNCWSDCSSDGTALTQAIQDMADGISLTELDPSLVASDALTLFDGTLASGGGRFETNLIAKWEFKTGSGNIAFDTSGVDPALDLTLSGQYNWVGGWGIQLLNGKAQGTTTSSRKLHDLIVGTGEFAIEAWVAPANVTQEGPARIVSYSGGRDRRNMTLGQTLYNYNALLRNSNTDLNGEPALSTADADEDLQAALQHVVYNYDPINGRRIFVNGVFTDDQDETEPAGLSDWDESFAMVLGNEASGDVPWAGIIRMVAVHNRALSEDQISKNFDVGIGQKFFLLFGISHVVDIDDAYLVFEVSQFDSYSYLFAEPFMISLSNDNDFTAVPVKGMRIGINGRESSFGQVFATLDTQLDTSTYIEGAGQSLSQQGTIISLEKGPELDEFFLTFDMLGDQENVRVAAAPPTPAIPVDIAPQSDIGMRNFAEVNATMSALTGVPTSNTEVDATFTSLIQQLPSVTAFDSFLASNQMAITQLAIKYCDQLVEDDALRSSLFPGFDFSQSADTAFSAGNDDLISTTLANHMLPGNLNSQPEIQQVENEVSTLINRLATCSQGNACDATYTRTIVKASCAAVLGSAAVLVQ